MSFLSYHLKHRTKIMEKVCTLINMTAHFTPNVSFNCNLANWNNITDKRSWFLRIYLKYCQIYIFIFAPFPSTIKEITSRTVRSCFHNNSPSFLSICITIYSTVTNLGLPVPRCNSHTQQMKNVISFERDWIWPKNLAWACQKRIKSVWKMAEKQPNY